MSLDVPDHPKQRITLADALFVADGATLSSSLKGSIMKRDLNLVHKLLLFVEERGSRLFKGSISIEGYERDEVIHHLFLVVDAGFVELGGETIAHQGPLVLTWKGYDYLEELGAQAR